MIPFNNIVYRNDNICIYNNRLYIFIYLATKIVTTGPRWLQCVWLWVSTRTHRRWCDLIAYSSSQKALQTITPVISMYSVFVFTSQACRQY